MLKSLIQAADQLLGNGNAFLSPSIVQQETVWPQLIVAIGEVD